MEPKRSAARMSQHELGIVIAIPMVSVALAIAAQYLGWDLWLARHFYDAELGRWPFRDAWLTQDVMHLGGRRCFNLIALVQLVLIAASFFSASLRPWRKLMTCTLFAMALGPLAIGFVKAHSYTPAPWALAVFGGDSPHFALFDAVPAGQPIGHAFPAGHASGGFMLIALYLTLRHLRPQLRWVGLGVGLFPGFLLGFGQQARGAHFLSHDLISLAICWACGWAVFGAFYGRCLTGSVVAATPARAEFRLHLPHRGASQARVAKDSSAGVL